MTGRQFGRIVAPAVMALWAFALLISAIPWPATANYDIDRLIGALLLGAGSWLLWDPTPPPSYPPVRMNHKE